MEYAQPQQTDHNAYLERMGLPHNWPDYQAKALAAQVERDVNRRPETKSFAERTGYVEALVNYGNALCKPEGLSCDLTDPESVAAAQAVAYELANQSKAAEETRAFAAQRLASSVFFNEALRSIPQDEIPPHLVSLVGYATVFGAQRQTYQPVEHGAARLADMRQTVPSSPVRSDPDQAWRIGFDLPESPLTEAMRPLSDRRIATSDARQAPPEYVAPLGRAYTATLDVVTRHIGREITRAMHIIDVLNAHNAPENVDPNQFSEIGQQQNAVAAALASAARQDVHDMRCFTADLARERQRRWDQAIFDSSFGHDLTADQWENDVAFRVLFPNLDYDDPTAYNKQ